MREWRLISILAGLALVVAIVSSGGCGPVSTPGDIDAGGGSESGSESHNADASTSDSQSSDSTTADNATSDTAASDTGTQDTGGTDSTTQDTGGTDTGSTDTTTHDTGGTDTTTHDNGGTDTGGPDTGDPACVDKGGYCDDSQDPCRKGYSDANDTLGCPGGNTARCCLLDAPPPQCTSDKECPSKCSGNGVCQQVQYICKGGKCVEGQTVSQPNAKCDAATGQCVRLTPGCKGPCDCQQGFSCSNGQCLSGTKPVYCCDNAGCPAGQACVDKAGQAGKCPTATTDCDKQGGYCTPQNVACQKGHQLNTAIQCGNVRSLSCCMPTTNKCATVKCAGPTCALGRDGSCTQSASTCNPKTGLCEKSSKTAKLSCRQNGTGCIQTKPGCSNNQCTAVSSTLANYTCDTKTGQCNKTSSGNACTQKKGICVTQNTKCPTNYKLDTSVACGTIRSQVCCVPATNKCLTVKCSKPICATGSDGSCSVTSYTCNPATGNCDKASKGIKSTCSQNGNSCTTHVPGCSNSQCTVTDKTSKPSCRQSGTTCTQSQPSCSNNQCLSKIATYNNYKCDTGTGLCVRSAPVCTVSCDCPQGQMCSGGQCIAGTKPVYCCAKAGCPAGQKCLDKSGNSGICPSIGSNACTQQKGVCVVQNTACPASYRLDTSVACGTTRSLQCCLPDKCATVRCQGPSCTSGSTTNGSCTQTTYTCNPATGNCDKKSSSSAPTCRMKGTSCQQSTPTCSSNQCTSRVLTAAPSCSQSGTSCVQVLPSCGRNGQCAKTSKTIVNNTCNTTTGLCAATPKTCASAGGACQNSRLACRLGTKPYPSLPCASLAQICCAP